MVGWHHRLNGREFEQAPGVGDGQGSLVCCSPWCRKELNTTESSNKEINGFLKLKETSEFSLFHKAEIPCDVISCTLIEYPW